MFIDSSLLFFWINPVAKEQGAWVNYNLADRVAAASLEEYNTILEKQQNLMNSSESAPANAEQEQAPPEEDKSFFEKSESPADPTPPPESESAGKDAFLGSQQPGENEDSFVDSQDSHIQRVMAAVDAALCQPETAVVPLNTGTGEENNFTGDHGASADRVDNVDGTETSTNSDSFAAAATADTAASSSVASHSGCDISATHDRKRKRDSESGDNGLKHEEVSEKAEVEVLDMSSPTAIGGTTAAEEKAQEISVDTTVDTEMDLDRGINSVKMNGNGCDGHADDDNTHASEFFDGTTGTTATKSPTTPPPAPAATMVSSMNMNMDMQDPHNHSGTGGTCAKPEKTQEMPVDVADTDTDGEAETAKATRPTTPPTTPQEPTPSPTTTAPKMIRNPKIVRSLSEAMMFYQDCIQELADTDDLGCLIDALQDERTNTVSTSFSGC